MSPDEIQAVTDRINRMVRELRMDRLRRFDLQYPVGHAEREQRMPAEIRALRAELQNPKP